MGFKWQEEHSGFWALSFTEKIEENHSWEKLYGGLIWFSSFSQKAIWNHTVAHNSK